MIIDQVSVYNPRIAFETVIPVINLTNKTNFPKEIIPAVQLAFFLFKILF